MIRLLAYVDPGAGSFVLQAAVGAVMGVSYVVRNRFKGIIRYFKREPRLHKPDETE